MPSKDCPQIVFKISGRFDITSGGSLDMVLTRFSSCYNGKVRKVAFIGQHFTKLAKELIGSFKH